MTLQQLQYIVAVDKYRHFVNAARACGVTQSTLSSMIKGLENELDVIIFDRNSHPVRPTPIGERILSQAKVVLYNAGQLSEIPDSEKEASSGKIRMGIIPTVASYVLPGLFRKMKSLRQIELTVTEATTATIVDRLRRAEFDMAILATPLNDFELLEIPLYYEKFYAYVSEDDPLSSFRILQPSQLPGDSLWVLKEGHCFRNQIANFCSRNLAHSMVYESGSIDTLVRIVDANGGHTIIPELHLPMLTERQAGNVRKIAEPEPVREISLVIRRDYVKEKLLNTIADVIKEIIPSAMLDERLKKFAVRI